MQNTFIYYILLYQRGNKNSYIEEEQTNGQKEKKYKKSNNYLQNIHIKLKIE
jgi:hypothetical protein